MIYMNVKNSRTTRMLNIVRTQIFHKMKFDFKEQGRKRPLYTPKRMIVRRERERKVEGEI